MISLLPRGGWRTRRRLVRRFRLITVAIERNATIASGRGERGD